jgi:hypothetical protein
LLFEFKLKWKYAQKKEKNSISSDKINKIIAYWKPFWTSIVCAPDCSSEKTSNNQVSIILKNIDIIPIWPNVQIKFEYQTFDHIEFKIFCITVKKPKLSVIGRTLGFTRWYGCPKIEVNLIAGSARNDEKA